MIVNRKIIISLILFSISCSQQVWAQNSEQQQFADDFRIMHHQKPEGLRFSKSRLASKSANNGETVSVQPKHLSFDAFGRQFELELESNEQLLNNLPLKQKKNLTQSTQIYKGHISGVEGSWVRLSKTAKGLSGAIWDGTELFLLDNSEDVTTAINNGDTTLATATPQTIAYRLSDTVTTSRCGLESTSGKQLNNLASIVGELQNQAQQLPTIQAAKKIDVAIVTDAEFTSTNSTNPEAAVMSRINVVDGIYSEQVDVHINVTEIRALTNNGILTGTSISTISDQFDIYVKAPGFTNPGLAHLFVGRNVSGNVVGLAWIGTICESLGAGVSSTKGTGTAGALVVAHEMGHNFGASHDNQTGSICASTPGTYIMNPFQNGSTQFSPCSLQSIANTIARQGNLCISDNPLFNQIAEVSLALPVNPVSAKVASPFNFSVEVQSTGTTAAVSSTASISIPNGLTINTATSSIGQCSINSTSVSCNLGSLAINSTTTIKLNATPSISGRLVSNISVSASNDANTANNSKSLAFNVAALPPSPVFIPAPTVTPTSPVTPATAAIPTILAEFNFNKNLGGFTYIDDVFRNTKNPAYASGKKTVTANDGRLQVSLNGRNNRPVSGVSGGWRKTFDLATSGTVSITFDYKVDLVKTYKANLYTEALVSVDGKLLGINGLDSLIHLVSNNKNNAKKATITSSGKLTASVTTDMLFTGTHTLIIGGYSNKKASKNDSSNITFDNIKLTMP